MNVYLFLEYFQDAVDFFNAHRNTKPAIYHRRRLKEMPIPSLGCHNNFLTQFETQRNYLDSSTESENDSSVGPMDSIHTFIFCGHSHYKQC